MAVTEHEPVTGHETVTEHEPVTGHETVKSTLLPGTPDFPPSLHEAILVLRWGLCKSGRKFESYSSPHIQTGTLEEELEGKSGWQG